MATDSMLRDAYDLMTCEACRQPAILTDEHGLCPRCFYKHECEAICAAAEEEVDRVLTETGPLAALPSEDTGPTRVYHPASEEQAWGW